MNRVTIQEMQTIELNILRYLRETCRQHNLKYYLAYGTLIGAVRHRGFIPWDDDVDVMMPREDYKKLMSVINNPDNTTYYKMVSVDSNPDFTAPLAKIIDTRTKLIQHYGFIEKVELGVYIDIFILDGVPGDFESGKEYYNKAYEIYRKWNKSDTMMFSPRENKVVSFLKWVKHIPLKIRGYKYWLNLLEKHNSRYSFYETEFVSVLEAGTKGADRNVWPREWFGDKGVVIFEGEEFSAPENFDSILRVEYGDYMKLPSDEKQVSHHYSEVFWKE